MSKTKGDPLPPDELKKTVKTLAQSAVGVRINQLTDAQVKSLLVILLWKAGAIDKDLKVNSLEGWI